MSTDILNEVIVERLQKAGYPQDLIDQEVEEIEREFEGKMEERAKTSPLAKWGEPLLDEGYTVIPNLFLKNLAKLDLSTLESLVIIQLLVFEYIADRKPFPSLVTIAQRCNVSTKSVKRALKSLAEEKKLVEWKRRINSKGQASNEYDLTNLKKRLYSLSR